MNLILQHFAGPMPDWAYLAEKTMRRYAKRTGADYKLVRGFPMGEKLSFTPQKLCMLLEEYDEYDQVCMIDMDTIATDVYESFWDIPQIGVLHDRAMGGENAKNAITGKPHPSRTHTAAPELYEQGEWCFFGNWIKLNREQRQELRKHWDQELFENSLRDHYSGDEIILHYLLHKSQILAGKKINEVCMRCDGTSWEDIHYRDYNRIDKKFCNQPEDSDPDASIIHFCASRKRMIVPTVNKIFEGLII